MKPPVDKEYPKPSKDQIGKGKEGDLVPDPSVEDFFSRGNYDMRRPKPGQEAVSAALQAIQRLGVQTDSEDSIAAEDATAEDAITESAMCAACGNLNPTSNKFCATCGVPLPQAPAGQRADVAATTASAKPVEPAPGPHHYHHHYHHHYFVSEGATQPGASPSQARDTSAPARELNRGRTPLTGSTLSRAEAAVRKITQDWALACNTTHLDDLVELYAADALVLRPNVPPVRGTASIREFLFSVLDAGLGEVELDPLRVELFGDVACEAGRCKMLVPTATGKRREERGKYLIVLTKQAGEWRIIADCWSSDLSMAVGAEIGVAKAGDQATGNSQTRLPRKGI